MRGEAFLRPSVSTVMASALWSVTARPPVHALPPTAVGSVACRIQAARGVNRAPLPLGLTARVRHARGCSVRATSEPSDATKGKMDNSTAAQVAVVAQAEGLVKGLEAPARSVSMAGELTQKGVAEVMEDKEGDRDSAVATVAFWVRGNEMGWENRMMTWAWVRICGRQDDSERLYCCSHMLEG